MSRCLSYKDWELSLGDTKGSKFTTVTLSRSRVQPHVYLHCLELASNASRYSVGQESEGCFLQQDVCTTQCILFFGQPSTRLCPATFRSGRQIVVTIESSWLKRYLRGLIACCALMEKLNETSHVAKMEEVRNLDNAE